MLGAIIGDIAGSKFEFDPCNDYNLDLFGPGHDFTDDTICTVAVADAILKAKPYDEAVYQWCRKYPHPTGSYGGRFSQWVRDDKPRPYESYGNGSAMRVSPVAWAFNTREMVLDQARATAVITHNHAEGIRGAQTVALAIWLSRNGMQTPQVLKQCHDFSGYDLNIKPDAVRNRFDETCQGTVPVALWIIGQSENFEDALRRAVSLGADADTLGAIVGSIAQAIWPIPPEMVESAKPLLPHNMKSVIKEFDRRYL